MSVFGIFTTGCIVGIVLSYTNFIGFLAGAITGIFIQANGPQLGNSIMDFITKNTGNAIVYVKSINNEKKGDDDIIDKKD